MKDLKIALRKPSSLKDYENNPRFNDHAVDAVVESIREFGFRSPILIDGNDVIIAGHTRKKAAEILGLDKVPTIKISDLSDEQVAALRLADIVCQSQADEMQLLNAYPNAAINPLGHWTGGLDVDTGATNRKLGSDMGGSVTGGGLHGKDLSKADVSVNIYAWLKAQATGQPVELFCAIGDEKIDDRPYQEIMQIAGKYIRKIGGFEKFAEWGLLRPDGPAMAELLRDLP